jgi:L-alanine-DL-glutamate epimerase-like enolase superfamily enzyme
MPSLTVRRESWPIRGKFTISRGSRTAAEVVVAELSDGDLRGRGECVPYARYGESVDSVVEAIEGVRSDLANGLDREALQGRLPAGAARNALDCAFWDLEAKRAGKRVWDLIGLDAPEPVATAFTLSLDDPPQMALQAKQNAERPLLKLKLAGPEDLDRVAAVRTNAPRARIIVDANEGWDAATYKALAPQFKDLGVEIVRRIDKYYEDRGDAFYLRLGDEASLVERLSSLLRR